MQSSAPRIRFLAALAAGVGSIGIPLPARAQTAIPFGPGQQRQQMPRRSVESLADFVGKLDWNAPEQGALLIVSPEETFAAEPQSSSSDAADNVERTEPPAALTSGGYKTRSVAAYFDRSVVRVNSVFVFAPRTMTVLNYKNLPAPNSYAGLAAPTKLQLLESTFSDAQWAQASGDEGIGAGDMTESQRELYLSILPDPFVVAPLNTGTQANAQDPPPTTLSGGQRTSTRLVLNKRMTWAFQQPHGGTTAADHDHAAVDFGYTLRLISEQGYQGGRDELGIELRSVVPNRPKTSQLPADWPALDRAIPVDPAKTVGALVALIARQTGARLYCDPRYAERKLYMRGASAQAGDLLRALGWALTATWRRLGDCFVLTDDVVGLGARHALIDEWAQGKVLVDSIRDIQVETMLSDKAYRALNWSNADPLKPSAELAAKLDTFFDEPLVPREDGPYMQSPLIALADLPQAAQEEFRSDLDHLTKALPRIKMRSDVANIGAEIQVAYNVPGVGRMAASGLPWFFGNRNLLAKPYVPALPINTSPAAVIPALFTKIRNRALMVDPLDDADLATIAREARHRGFTQLWITCPPGDSRRAAAAVRAGKENQLAVFPVLRIMRAPVDSPSEALDRNILGETVAEYVHNRLRQAHEIFAKVKMPAQKRDGSDRFTLPTWANDQAAAIYLRRGDFRQNNEAERLKAAEHVQKIAAIPDVAGLILAELAPPGFEAPPKEGDGRFFSDPHTGMGYDAATRLACLEKLGFDPIDVSPLDNGDEGLDMALPFFRDYAHFPFQHSRYDRFIAPRQNTNIRWEEWCAFRHDLSVAAYHAVVGAVRSLRPGMQLMTPHRNDAGPLQVNWYSAIDTSNPDRIGSVKRGNLTPRPDRRFVDNLDLARAESPSSYFPCVFGGSYDGSEQSKARIEQDLRLQLGLAAEWDGVVIDLTAASGAQSLDIVRMLRNPEGMQSAAPATP